MLQGKGSSFFDYGLSVNKSFLDKRLTLSAFASNFFKKYMGAKKQHGTHGPARLAKTGAAAPDGTCHCSHRPALTHEK